MATPAGTMRKHWASLSNILLGFGDIYSTEEVIALFEA